MQVTYRGTVYQPETLTFLLETPSTVILGQYRGATFAIGTIKREMPKVPVMLRYRGTNYLSFR